MATLVRGSLTIQIFGLLIYPIKTCPESTFSSTGLFVIVQSIDLSSSVLLHVPSLPSSSSILSSFSICSFSVELESAYGAQSAALFSDSLLATIGFPTRTNSTIGEY
jgi:hypothetical protein